MCGREQCVHSGVPQGPILFVLFINDLAQGIDQNSNIALYPDNTKLWHTIKSDYDIQLLHKEILYLHNWSINNKINFNLE